MPAFQQALATHLLKLANFGLHNAHIKNGVPLSPSAFLDVTVNERQEPEANSNSSSGAAATSATQSASLPSWLKTAALLGVTALTAGGGAAAYIAATGAPAVIKEAANQGAADQESLNLLQYLEDRGMNQPPEERAK
jgi:hypothetical protein